MRRARFELLRGRRRGLEAGGINLYVKSPYRFLSVFYQLMPWLVDAFAGWALEIATEEKDAADGIVVIALGG